MCGLILQRDPTDGKEATDDMKAMSELIIELCSIDGSEAAEIRKAMSELIVELCPINVQDAAEEGALFIIYLAKFVVSLTG